MEEVVQGGEWERVAQREYLSFVVYLDSNQFLEIATKRFQGSRSCILLYLEKGCAEAV